MQCSIDLNDNVLRVGGGEHAVPFLQGTVSCKAQEHVFEYSLIISQLGQR